MKPFFTPDPCSRAGRLAGTLLVLMLANGCSTSPASPSGRITQPIDPARVTLAPGNLRPLLARAEDDQGRLDGATPLPGITLHFSLSSAQASERAALLADLQDRGSPRYHQWLSPEQYAERFGLCPGDLVRIVTWLEDEGFTVQRIARSATEITVAGTVAQVEATFHTEVHRYLTDGDLHFAMAREPSLPEAVSGVVAGLRGLDDFAPRPLYTLNGQHYVAPEDFSKIYDVQKLYEKGLDGSGISIGIVGATSFTMLDITTFRGIFFPGLPNDPTSTLVPGSGTAAYVNPAAIGEAELDIELAGAVAPKAKIVYVYTGGGAGYSIHDALQYAIDNKVADIVSMSAYFGCEQTVSASAVTALQNLGDQANALGVTVVVASGDSGAAGCDAYGTLPLATKGPAVQLPSSLPQFTAVGGTELTEGAGNYWNATNDALYGSVLSYIPEKAWNDSVAQGKLWAGGGGASKLFPKPAWQAGVGVPNDGQRDVPDVSMAASGFHDALVCYFTPPAGNNGSGLYFVGGTSAAAPSFAGVLALVAQATGSGALGNVNPMLYKLAAESPAAFHDVTAGDNVVPCKQGTTGCPGSAPFQYGFSAGPGYDLATGLGSVDAFAFVNAWVACQASACGATSDAGTTGPDAGGTGGATATGHGGSAGTTSSGQGGGAVSATGGAATTGTGAGSSANHVAGCGTCGIAAPRTGTEAQFGASGMGLLALLLRRRWEGSGRAADRQRLLGRRRAGGAPSARRAARRAGLHRRREQRLDAGLLPALAGRRGQGGLALRVAEERRGDRARHGRGAATRTGRAAALIDR